MKAKKKRVQPNEFDFSTLGGYERTVYISGLLGSLISTISNQTLVKPEDIIISFQAYVETFNADDYLSKTKFCRDYIHHIIDGDFPCDNGDVPFVGAEFE